jgi:LTXXQ motif family protein
VPPARGEDGPPGAVIPINMLYWPQAYYELLGSTFAIGAIGDNKDRFWNHGLGDFYTGMIGPPAGAAPGKRRAAAESEPPANGACLPARPPEPEVGPAGTTFRQIEKRVAPTPEQRASFDALQAAMLKAEQRIYSGCWQPYPSQSPPERLKTIADRLWALRQAMLMLRTPLEQALETLSDAQKAKLNGKGPLKLSCPDPLINEASWTGERVEQVLQLTDEQRASLESLRLVAIHLGQAIGSSCPSQSLASPLQRLDAIGDRLNTLLYAAMIVSRSFNNFYVSLSDEQKTRFRTMARSLPPPRRSADVGTP